MKIYIDSEFKCYATDQDGTFREVETSFFDGKCDTFIEGYRYIPSGESWTREDGVAFIGEMITPYKDHVILLACQEQYEKDLQKIQELTEALEVVGVTV